MLFWQDGKPAPQTAYERAKARNAEWFAQNSFAGQQQSNPEPAPARSDPFEDLHQKLRQEHNEELNKRQQVYVFTEIMPTTI